MNYKEKYLRINLDYAPMAGKLDQTIQAQKRLIERLAKRKDLPDDVKALIVSVADSIDVGEDLLTFTGKFFHGVVEDAHALLKGAEVRNIEVSQKMADELRG